MPHTTNLLVLSNSSSIPNFAEENSVLKAWAQFAASVSEGNVDVAFEELRFSDVLSDDFRTIVNDLDNSKIPKEDLAKIGKDHIEKLILQIRKLQGEVETDTNFAELIANIDENTLSRLPWKTILKNIVDRVQNESSYFTDAATSGALEITEDGLLSKQLTALIIPIKNKSLQKIIPQPVFFTDIGVILHPGEIPTKKDVALKLATTGKFPASFAKLQESVSEILSWPRKQRIKSFCFSAAAGLVTIPFSLAAKVIIYIPRVLGVRWLKQNALFFKVDPVLEKAFSVICSNGHHSATLSPRKHLDVLNEKIKSECPDASNDKIKRASRNLIELQALGCSIHEIGEMIHGCKFDKKQQLFPKLEKAISERCNVMKINFQTGRDHLLDLDDAAWRISFTESRLIAMKIARQEITRAIGSIKS